MMARRWWSDPRYSHGFLVPAFALYWLLSHRSTRPASSPGRPTTAVRWWGVALLALGAVLRAAGARYWVNWLEAASLLPALAGLALLAGGVAALRWAWPAIGFLIFMIPLPYRLEVALGQPLQHGATLCSTFILQLCGLTATAEGNVILLRHARIGVVEACNGLGMLCTFTAMATAVAIAVPRPRGDRTLIVLSALPISFCANVVRITATGLMRELVGARIAEAVYHDLAGWLMMPLALFLLWAELRLLSRLLVGPAVRAAGDALSFHKNS
jgi:exosortase